MISPKKFWHCAINSWCTNGRQAGPNSAGLIAYLWLLLLRAWPNWRNPLMIFQPETLIGWQQAPIWI
jgi:hypothetical protein